MKKIYIETSVISYAASDTANDIIVAARQIITKELWEKLSRYKVFISNIVVIEVGKGKENQAAKRLKIIEDFNILELSSDVENLANILITLLLKMMLKKLLIIQVINHQ